VDRQRKWINQRGSGQHNNLPQVNPLLRPLETSLPKTDDFSEIVNIFICCSLLQVRLPSAFVHQTGSVKDDWNIAHPNAINGLHTDRIVRAREPWRIFVEAGLTTLEWIWWFIKIHPSY
jgi:hypothetical protein